MRTTNTLITSKKEQGLVSEWYYAKMINRAEGNCLDKSNNFKVVIIKWSMNSN